MLDNLFTRPEVTGLEKNKSKLILGSPYRSAIEIIFGSQTKSAMEIVDSQINLADKLPELQSYLLPLKERIPKVKPVAKVNKGGD